MKASLPFRAGVVLMSGLLAIMATCCGPTALAITPDSPDVNFPLAALQTQLQTDGVATQMSNQPGEESCNSLFYQLLTAENQLQTWPAKGQPMSILMQVLLVHVGVGIPQADAQTFSQQIIEAILDADATIKLN